MMILTIFVVIAIVASQGAQAFFNLGGGGDCASHCSRCSAGTCSECKAGYFLSVSLLGSNCGACGPYCSHCSGPDTCQTCKSGYVKEHTTGFCMWPPNHACQTNCVRCSNPDTCDQCMSGFTYDAALGACTKDLNLCGVNHCSHCGEFVYCNSCNPGYALTAFVFDTCTACEDSACLRCRTPGVCSLCRSGYTLSDGSCIEDVAVVCMDHCESCTSADTCEQCEDQYSLRGDQCQPDCIEDCVVCSEPNTCQQCMNGYEYDSDKNTCIEVVCMNHCLYCGSSTTCDQCEDQYSYREGQCQPDCVENCAFCESPGSCEQCTDGYRYNAADAECVEIPDVGFRLRQGASVDTNVGLVEILLDEVWHPVCAQGWDQQDGNVLCRSLGYANTGALTKRVLVTDEDLQPYFSRFRCTGREATLLECRYTSGEKLKVDECNSSTKFAWVTCSTS